MNGSLHTIPITDEPDSVRSEPSTLNRQWPADQVIRAYLAEVDRRHRSSAGAQHRRTDPAVDPAVVARGKGRALTIASDAHAPDWLARNFYEAMAMVEHSGFRPGRRPQDVWRI